MHIAMDSCHVQQPESAAAPTLQAGAYADAVDGSSGSRAIDIAATKKARGAMSMLHFVHAEACHCNSDAYMRDVPVAWQTWSSFYCRSRRPRLARTGVWMLC